jgi:hypothetical protein
MSNSDIHLAENQLGERQFGSAIPRGASVAVVSLLKGVLYQNMHEDSWQALLQNEGMIRDYLQGLFLELVIDPAEGYAYLRQRDTDGTTNLNLIQKRPLGYLLSLLCALLRKRLIENDSASGELRLILSREQIRDSVRVFLPPSSNEARLDDAIDRAINRLQEYGFLHRLKGGEENLFEVRRIIKALVDAAWLNDLNQLLEEYRKHADLAL